MSSRGLLVSYGRFLERAHGGVQVCTREYIAVLEAAGYAISTVAFDSDRRLSSKILRRLNSSAYFRPFPKNLVAEVVAAARAVEPDVVFLNQVTIGSLAAKLRPHLPAGCKIVVLSHGLEVTDLAHYLRLRASLPLSGRARPSASGVLNFTRAAEATSRRDVDLVVTLTSEDAQQERALGVSADWLPRVVKARPLAWRPQSRRFGYVGTLDHAPNLEGLTMVLDAFARQGGAPQIRIIGGPPETGAWVARRYPFVEFLGGLDDAGLEAEAASWNAFIHPVFCAARGCSTKLAQAMAWQIPIVTTPQGRRGYVFERGGLIEADTAEAFAQACLALSDSDAAAQARANVVLACETSPSLADVAARMRALIS